jgi:hypothetical protein
MPTYSSRWKPVTLSHRIESSAASTASISNCDAPVATMMLVEPLRAIASLMIFAPCSAARWPISCFVSAMLVFNVVLLF